MKIIQKGDIYGVYEVIDVDTKYTVRGGRRYKCVCGVCGKTRKYSECFLRRVANKICRCLCEKETRVVNIQRDYNYVTKNYGRINLCGFCTNIFKCAKYKQNAIDKRYMINCRVDKISSATRNRNLILVYDCKKFNFDWGGFL